jgi:hypothetical protein
VGKGPHRAVVHCSPRSASSATSPRKVKSPSAIRARSQSASPPWILRGTYQPILAGAALPVARHRCDHFTKLDGTMLRASPILCAPSVFSTVANARSP